MRRFRWKIGEKVGGVQVSGVPLEKSFENLHGAAGLEVGCHQRHSAALTLALVRGDR